MVRLEKLDIFGETMKTKKQINKLHRILNGFNIIDLHNEAFEYCLTNRKDLRVYKMALKLAENQKNPKKFLDEMFTHFNKIDNFTNIWTQFAIEQLSNEKFGVINYCTDGKVKRAVKDVISLLSTHNERNFELSTHNQDFTNDHIEISTNSAVWSLEAAIRCCSASTTSANWFVADSAKSIASSVIAAPGSLSMSDPWYKVEKLAGYARSGCLSSFRVPNNKGKNGIIDELGNCFLEILKKRVL